MMRRAIAALLAVTALLSVWLWYCHATRPWREWQAFARVFVQADGRVIDRTAGSRSTSEAQAYGLFFAFVANDRERFARILGWTANNLAGGDLKTQLPAWLWGLKPDGSWGVIDANPASDADLWLAYTLIEAARLWRQPEHRVLGEAILRQVKAQEIAEVPGFGLMLIPAPQGFKAEDGGWRLNPSYLPRGVGPRRPLGRAVAEPFEGHAPAAHQGHRTRLVPGDGQRRVAGGCHHAGCLELRRHPRAAVGRHDARARRWSKRTSPPAGSAGRRAGQNPRTARKARFHQRCSQRGQSGGLFCRRVAFSCDNG